MIVELVQYEADGLAMDSWLYAPKDAAGRRPGVLVFPEAFGLNDHAKQRAQRLADEGYVAVACDIHGGGRIISDMDEVMAQIVPLRHARHRLKERGVAALDALKSRPEVDADRIAAIGHCFGATMSFELARSSVELSGVVGFHGGINNDEPDKVYPIKTPILACIGADDPTIPAEKRVLFEEEMRKAKADYQLHLYGNVVHSFTNPEADARGIPETARFDACADRRSWQAMRNFFDEIFA